MTVKLPRDMTSGFYPLDQFYMDCAGASQLHRHNVDSFGDPDPPPTTPLPPPLTPSPTENCLLRFIQIALIDCGGDGRAINSARARELGATVEISE